MHQIDMLTEIMIKQQKAEREAQVERRYLVRMAQEQNRVSLYRPLLAGLGRRLVTWGTQLQRHNDPCYRVPEVSFASSSK